MTAQNIEARQDWVNRSPKIYIANDGSKGKLADCYISSEDSACPRRWMFRLGTSKTWHWEFEVKPVAVYSHNPL